MSVCLCVQWVLADESTGVAGTHQQLSALDKPHEQVLISSMWDIPTPFRVRIIGLDKLKKEIQVGGEGRGGGEWRGCGGERGRGVERVGRREGEGSRESGEESGGGVEGCGGEWRRCGGERGGEWKGSGGGGEGSAGDGEGRGGGEWRGWGEERVG